MQSAMLVEEAAKMPAKRWATVAPNYEYGQRRIASFKELLKARRPDVEFVAEQWPVLGKTEAGSTLQVLAQAKTGRNFQRDVWGRSGQSWCVRVISAIYFRAFPWFHLLSGEPEYLDAQGRKRPRADRYWLPWIRSTRPEHASLPPTTTSATRRTPKWGRWWWAIDHAGYFCGHCQGQKHGQ